MYGQVIGGAVGQLMDGSPPSVVGDTRDQDRGSLRLTADAGKVHRLDRRMIARAVGAEPRQTIHVMSDERDVPCSTLQRIERRHFLKPRSRLTRFNRVRSALLPSVGAIAG